MKDAEDTGIVGAMTAEPPKRSKDDAELHDAAATFLGKGEISDRAAGDDAEPEDDDRDERRRRRRDDDDPRGRRASRDEDEEDDDLDDEDDLDDDEDEDEFADEDDEDDDELEDDDDVELRRRRPRRSVEDDVRRTARDVRETLRAARNRPPANQTKQAETDTADKTAFSEEDLKEFEEINPGAAKVIKGLLRQLKGVQETVLAGESRRSMVEINQTFDKVAKKFGLSKELGAAGRSSSTGQRERRRDVIVAAHEYAKACEESGRPIDAAAAIKAVVFEKYHRQILRGQRKGATDKLTSMAQRRARQFDPVPRAGSIARRRGNSGGRDGDGGDERSLLGVASAWINQNRRRR